MEQEVAEISKEPLLACLTQDPDKVQTSLEEANMAQALKWAWVATSLWAAMEVPK